MTDFHNRSVCLLGAGVSNMPLAEYLLRCSRRPGKVKVLAENGEICFRAQNSRTDVQK